MRIIDKLNYTIHPWMVKRMLTAYSKKIKRHLNTRPELSRPVDSETTRLHTELYKKLDLPVNDIWLRCYTNLTGVKDYRYLPEDLFYARIERVLNDCNRLDSEAEDKNLLSIFVDKEYLPTTVFKFIRGVFYDSEFSPIGEEKIKRLLSNDNGPLIGKVASESSGGHGVKLFSFNNGSYISKDGTRLTPEWIKKNFSNYLVQEKLEQCDFSKQFNPSSINTCRIITLRCPWDGNVIVTKACMRFGVTEDVTDNLGNGGLGIGISNDGELGNEAYSYNGYRAFANHPTTGLVFKGQKHPYFDKMCKVAIDQHRHIPNHNLVSWDMIINEMGQVKIIELNLVSQGTDIPQLAFGSFFGENTEKIIDWVADHLQYDSFKHFRTF